MVKIYLSSIQRLVSIKLHIEEQFKVEEHKKQNKRNKKKEKKKKEIHCAIH